MGNKQSKRDATTRQQQQTTDTEAETEEEAAARRTEEAAQREALYNAPPPRECALPETTAWAIATAHCEQLRGLMRLTTDASVSDPLALVQSYEWVDIEVLNSDHAAQARVATTAWLWLSCCAGYGGDENPRFWKRVFDELQRRGPHQSTAITDAIRFFDHADRAFPRIRLETTDFASARVFMGITEETPPTPAAQHDAQRLADTYRQLQPFLIASRVEQRTVDVAIQSHDIERILKRDDDELQLPVALVGQPDALLQQLCQAVGTGHAAAVESAVQTIVQQLTTPLPFSPIALVHPEAALLPPVAFAFHSLYMPSWSIHPTQQLHNACLWIPSTVLQIDELICESRSWGDVVFVETGDLATFQLRSLFGLESPGSDGIDTKSSSRGRRLVLQRQTLSRSLFAAVCSALPHAQSISSLCVAAPPPPKRGKGPIHRAPFRVFDTMNWAWLGYAIFHPDADTTEQSCTWRDLDLFVDDLTPRAVRILELMAMGNNLATVEATFPSKSHALPSIAPPHSTQYHLARLHTNTPIRRYPSRNASVLYHYVETPSQCQRFSVDNNTATRDDWVRVVLPGAGFGWVLATAVVDIVSRAPRGSARLRGLRLRSTSLLSPSRAALEFVLLVGSGLTRLHADACGELPPDKLLQLLLACPSLTTLSVIHNGSLWGDPRSVEHLRKASLKRGMQSSFSLTELSLTLPADKLVYFPESRSSHHRFEALRVVTHSDCFLRNRRALVAFLTAYASLAYVYWWDPKPRHHHNDYLSNRIHTHRLMGELPHAAAAAVSSSVQSQKCGATGAAGSVELCLRCRLAVVEAVAAAQRAPGSSSSSPSAFGRLDQDVLTLIFAFAPRCGLRDLWIGA